MRPLEPLSHGHWRWPDYPTRFYAGNEGQLALAAPNRRPTDSGDDYSVLVAARDAAARAYLDEIVDDSWEHFSRWEAD